MTGPAASTTERSDAEPQPAASPDLAHSTPAEPQPAASPDLAPSTPAGLQPAASGADLAGVFGRIPRVYAVRRRVVFWGLAGWGARHWVALAAASVVLAGLLGGFGPRAGWGAGWVAVVAAASALGGFVVASVVPRAGGRFAWSSCSALPLVGTLLVPAVLNPADPMTGVVGLGLLVALASRQATGAGC